MKNSIKIVIGQQRCRLVRQNICLNCYKVKYAWRRYLYTKISKRAQNKDKHARKHQKKTEEKLNVSNINKDTILAANIYNVVREKKV